mmetsp:Transcript_1963/g.2627  ORF Transcript_1963/g.2627 Transcript_1963/m.2627 type:complete len:113 (-) Transcript_1963:32-370(-)|eukprot:CAMPEP_0206531244 /NCGR_PEP_ID=MMETSP0325_2-20121206/3649_1 /ASSEMBLY_ACC=CAM_ASM_000347 /TAXON_ID=2866 /ORGANISM="Crypthecodinium cohnii, Strain Seligo" /LENGTH=112 /DNA_ID=CAMNT_0054027449 /DNA_START=187 /DNA_END=525 /DNA_ORIENTATION=+
MLSRAICRTAALQRVSMRPVVRALDQAPPTTLAVRARGQDTLRPGQIMEADPRVILIAGSLLCLGGSLGSVYVALTHDPNNKKERGTMQIGEYIAGASVVGALCIGIMIMRK